MDKKKLTETIEKWVQRDKDGEEIHRYGFEGELAKEVDESFEKPPQNSQDYLRYIANKDVKYRDLFIKLYGHFQGEEDTIRRWRDE